MIEADGLTKRYGETTAVNDLSFSVRPGIVTGFPRYTCPGAGDTTWSVAEVDGLLNTGPGRMTKGSAVATPKHPMVTTPRPTPAARRRPECVPWATA